jgi:hypothetical protein
MIYPTLNEVDAADHFQICTWWRRLPSPGSRAIGGPEFDAVLESETAIMNRIGARLKEFGGFTPSISKAIGWG